MGLIIKLKGPLLKNLILKGKWRFVANKYEICNYMGSIFTTRGLEGLEVALNENLTSYLV